MKYSYLAYVLLYLYKNISSRKYVDDLFSSVFKKIIPDATTPTFLEVGGVTILLKA